MGFEELLKKQCKKCTNGTLKTYLTSIRRLYHLEFEGEVPTDGKWLNSSKLFEKYKKIPVNIRRHLSTGAIKALQAYDMDTKKWYKSFMDDQAEYTKQRAKHEKTPNEKKKWTSVKQLKKAATDLKKRFRYILEAPPTLKNLYKIQWWLVIKLFTQIPVRNDFPTLRLKKSDQGNYIIRPKKGAYTFVFQSFKNSDKLGTREIKLSRSLTMAVRKFLKYRAGVEDLDHDYLLTGKQGKPMSKGSFGKTLRNMTLELLGKKIGSRIIRVVVATENKELIEKAAELSAKFLHGQKRTADYIRKD